MEPQQKLAELARERGTSLAALSRLIGRNSSYLQQYISKGSPKKLEEHDRRRLADFFGISEVELGAAEEKSYSNDGGEWCELPRLSIEASAGPGAMATVEGAFDMLRFSRRWLRQQGFEAGRLSVIRVTGDSMDPLLRDGDEILVERSIGGFSEGVHVVRMGDALHVKRVQAGPPGRVRLISANPAYEPLEVQLDEIEVIGRVVWKSGRI